MPVRTLVCCALMAGALAPSARAAEPWTGPSCAGEPSVPRVWAVPFGATAAERPAAPALRLTVGQAVTARRPVAVDYSDGYKVRARIHKVASFATLPIFGVMYYVGQDLYEHPGTDAKRSLHSGLAGATAGLFGVNTVTGVWNLWEGRKDTHHRGRRMAHGLLMLAADAGFVATGMLAPDDEDGRVTSTDDRRRHRTVALTSMGVATASYLLMLFGGD